MEALKNDSIIIDIGKERDRKIGRQIQEKEINSRKDREEKKRKREREKERWRERGERDSERERENND